MIDIPNFVTLPIEIGVAVLILLMDRRQRNRETEASVRFQKQQEQFRQSEIRQRERFNNFIQESSKRQIMLLESIMATLDKDRVDDFKSEVSSRYAEELSNDMEDLDELLNRKSKTDEVDPELEADIESKIDEIESGKDFIEHFLPRETIDHISNLANSATSAYKGLRDLPDVIKSRFPDEEGHVKINVNDKEFDIDPRNSDDLESVKAAFLSGYKMDRATFIESLNRQVQKTLEDVTRDLNDNQGSDSTAGKIVEVVKSSLLQSIGLGKQKEKEEDEETEDQVDEEN
ncbi:MAG: hypothetical protein ACXAE3_06040 [Candidatus Kariarchaeaceae archaeon]|jgi:hypothetical protein